MIVQVFKYDDTHPRLIARVEASLRRVFQAMPDAERGEVVKACRRAAKSTEVESVLLTLAATPAPFPHPAVLELARGDVERAGDDELDETVGRILRERVARLDSMLDERGESAKRMMAMTSRLAKVIFPD
jgi:hypothetical protein